MTDQTKPAPLGPLAPLDAPAAPLGPLAPPDARAAPLGPLPPPPLDLDDRLTLSAAEIAAAVNGGEISAVEIVEATLARIEAHREGHAYITVCPEAALNGPAKAQPGRWPECPSP